MREDNTYQVEETELSEQDHPLWKRDHIELKSVGIDIGSSTSHLIFSTLEMRRQSAALSSRFQITDRRIDYESPILLTPFIKGVSIDTDKLSAFISKSYKRSGLSPDEIDTGAVITTGDAARKDNAEAIVRMFSEQAGKFVCASAGPIMEAKMAAYGSGAVARSVNSGNPLTVMNIDVGGGTAKLAIVRDGAIVDTAAMNIGARLITFDEEGVLTRIENAAGIVSRHRNLGLEVGRSIDDATKQRLATALAHSLMELASKKPMSPLTSDLLITAPLTHIGKIDAVLFSGGVSEYLYETEATAYGDIGAILGKEIRDQAARYLPGVPVETPLQRIRATVIGASQFTVQVSGNTIYIANPDLLPLRNLQVVTVNFDGDHLTPSGIASAIQGALHHSDVQEGETQVALAVHWPWGPAYPLLRAFCLGVKDALENTVKNRDPVVLILDSDIARLIGNNLSRELGEYKNIICVDGIQLQDFDYVDISKEHPDARVVTVVIKSLIFSA